MRIRETTDNEDYRTLGESGNEKHREDLVNIQAWLIYALTKGE